MIAAATLFRVAGAFLALLAPAVSRAQTYTVDVQGGQPDIGRVVSSPSGATVFRMNPATGAVTRTSGSGVRLSTGLARTRVTISCGSSGTCNNSKVNLRIGSLGSSTGRAGDLTNFTISMGTASLDSSPTGSDPIRFTLKPIGKNSSKTFWLGADLPIDGNIGGGMTGAASSGFYVYAARYNQSPASGDTGVAVATVFRPISLSKNSNLSFGRFMKPTSGAGSVTVTPAGSRELTNVVAVPTPAAGSASYTVEGEGGRSISLSIPASFTMTGPGGPLTVQTLTDAQPAPVLSAGTGMGGSYGFQVGGALTLNSSTKSGGYTGSFAVTVSYN